MDINRANEIASSPDMASVTYNGTPIYIESVNLDKGMSYVYPLNQPDKIQPDKIQEVSVDSR